MSSRKTRFPRVPLRSIQELVERNGNGLPAKKARGAESAKSKTPKAVQSRGA